MIRFLPTFDECKPLELSNATPLRLQFSQCGSILAQRFETLLLNQVIPDPWSNGIFRIVLRERANNCVVSHSQLAGAGIPMAAGRHSIFWKNEDLDGLSATTQVQPHPTLPAWMWSTRISNNSGSARCADILFCQDIGIGDEGAVRTNEAYDSQYIDLNPLQDAELGWVVMARQNQATSDGKNPVLLATCLDFATAFCTDSRQFFGANHRLTGMALAYSLPTLPSSRLQYECAIAGLQSRTISLKPGESVTLRFALRFIPDHPAATVAADIRILDELKDWQPEPAPSDMAFTEKSESVFVDTNRISGDDPLTEDWENWFPGLRRNEERSGDGQLLSFFQGENTHVVSRRKEADIWRPQGHILRSGNDVRPDPLHFGLTCYAAGMFGLQAYIGNPSLTRFMPVTRDQLGVLRSTGQRVFVRRNGRWAQLGVPSAFAIKPDECVWIYRLGGTVLRFSARCLAQTPASILEAEVLQGSPCEFLLTHRLCVGSTEGTQSATVQIDTDHGTAMVRPSNGSQNFAIRITEASSLAFFGGDELLHKGAKCDSCNYLTAVTKEVAGFRLAMTASPEGERTLLCQLDEALSKTENRKEMRARKWEGPRFPNPVSPALSRVSEILPWFDHDAWIHFSAPHGLEQSGGGAWGVRDVCQGSMEWLLSIRRYDVAREVLCEVFRQQYIQDAEWPQWFMLPPFEKIRQCDSHGDILFWPLHALCLYIERSNDFSILDEVLPYTDIETFTPTEEAETVLSHCDRALMQFLKRLLPGTALVNYGNGDWDDTLQPANPELRTRMISAWTVGLAYQTLGQFARICSRIDSEPRRQKLLETLEQMRADFHSHLIVDGVVAGFLIRNDGQDTLLLHPHDDLTGIRYRLIPMTRAILAGLFTPEEARAHLKIIERELRFPDGVRLMSTPVPYRGGEQKFFRRAETAANVGREIGLMYVHAHMRYAEALARVGDAEGLWHAMQLVNPVGLGEILPQAQARQSNVFFSSSDADFGDRYEAAKRWEELRAGKVSVRGGWRLYSSGPGLFINLVRSCLLGIRESYDEVIFDPVLPKELDGLTVQMQLLDCDSTLRFKVSGKQNGAQRIAVNGTVLNGLEREGNPYRNGGLRAKAETLRALGAQQKQTLNIELDL